MSGLELIFLTRPGCHLCDRARSLVEETAADLGIPLREQNVDAHAWLAETYGERVPVVLAGDVVVVEGIIEDRRSLRRAIRRALRRC